MHEGTLSLDEAAAAASTGDIWLFRGRSIADRAIQTLTNSPVNHVGMVVAIDDLPPLLWHAELGRSLPDVWTGDRQRGVQLHRLDAAVTQWNERYGQRAWVRPLIGGTIEKQPRGPADGGHRPLRRARVSDEPRARARLGDRPLSPQHVAGDRLLRRARRDDVPGDGAAAERAPGELV